MCKANTRDMRDYGYIKGDCVRNCAYTKRHDEAN